MSTTHKENKNLRERIQQLEEENNLLKLKYEILIDMVSNVHTHTHTYI